MIDVKHDPTPREVRIFGGLWLAFFLAVGALAAWRPDGLVGAGTFLTAAWLVSLALNRETRRLQLLGALLPALFLGCGLAATRGVPPAAVAGAAAAAGVAGAIAILAAPPLGRQLYRAWMLAAVPIGWTVSHLVLAIAYYGVLTPIGLVMRLVGRDPMQRAFDRAAPTYWIERPRREPDPRRAFRQY
jgi:hypothetical protein